jgi:hypothetical protein
MPRRTRASVLPVVSAVLLLVVLALPDLGPPTSGPSDVFLDYLDPSGEVAFIVALV